MSEGVNNEQRYTTGKCCLIIVVVANIQLALVLLDIYIYFFSRFQHSNVSHFKQNAMITKKKLWCVLS